jgi:hypothetical protein
MTCPASYLLSPVGDLLLTAARHKHLVERAKRRSLVRLVLPATAATLVTGTVVAVSMATTGATSNVAVHRPAPVHATADYLADRAPDLSRSARRTTLQPLPDVEKQQYLTAPLNVWAEPRAHGKPLDVLASHSKVDVTGVVRHGFAQVLMGREVRWVNHAYLVDHLPKPKPTPKVQPKPEAAPSTAPAPSTAAVPTGGIVSGAACATGSEMESGIVANAIALHRAVCAHFPQVSEYGGYRPDGEHTDGHAIDIMVYSDSSTGQAVADWVRANASTLHVDEVIWAQRIWTTQRSSEGWRMMEDRGSTTANHYDHVHVHVS